MSGKELDPYSASVVRRIVAPLNGLVEKVSDRIPHPIRTTRAFFEATELFDADAGAGGNRNAGGKNVARGIGAFVADVTGTVREEFFESSHPAEDE